MRVNTWVVLLTELVAVIVKVYAPVDPVGGVPDRVAVPSWLSTKLAQAGRPVCPPPVDWLMVGVGDPVAVTMNVPAVPTVNPVALALVIAGGDVTVNVLLVAVSPEVPPTATTL